MREMFGNRHSFRPSSCIDFFSSEREEKGRSEFLSTGERSRDETLVFHREHKIQIVVTCHYFLS